MASFTDLIPQFNPYIQQLPVEAMVSVGMEKQKRYDEGLQKIQSQIEQVAGLNVMRPVDKQYLQSKLNELGSNLRGVAAGDFSNYQLVNSVGGMIGQVAKDPFIIASVKSSAVEQKNLEFMEADRKAGKLTPQNELNYLKQRQRYMQAGLRDENGNPIVFSGSYNPYFDVWKFAKETFDAVKPDGLSFDQVYETYADGTPKRDKYGKPIYSPVMVRYEKEGIFPEKVKQTLEQIFSDPRVGQQLQIDGEYDYRGYDEASLSQLAVNKKNQITAAYDDQIAAIALKINLTKDPAQKAALEQQLNTYQNKIDEVSTYYDQLAKSAIDNPDAVRGILHKNDVRVRYADMFGYTKEKTLQMDNPGWNANFKLMQEANAQSRFAQDLAFRKQQHRDLQAWKAADYQIELLKLQKKGKGKGDGEGGEGAGFDVELGDMPSTFDVVNSADSDYTKFASEFVNSSDEFLWQTVFSKVPKNNEKLDDLIRKGNTREQAMSLMINNAAMKNKQTPEAYRSFWGDKAVVEYNRSLAKGQVTHDLKDAYNLYKNARRNFDTASKIKQQIEDATEAQIGTSAAKALNTADIKPQKVKLYGKEYELSREDIVDLAIYLKGHESALGFLVDDGARRAGKAAGKRIEARGKGEFLDAILRTEGIYSSKGPGDIIPGPITVVARALKSPFRTLTDVFRSDSADSVDFSQVRRVYNMIDKDEYAEGLNVKANIIKNAYGIRPNLKASILTGDTETDKKTIYDLRRFAGANTAGQKLNLSPDFDKFMDAISGDLSKLALETQVVMDANNNPVVEVVAYDVTSGKRKGGMTVQPDEAGTLGIDINSLYEPREVSLMRNLMSRKNGKTSDGDPREASTYLSGDAWFEKADLPGMANSPYDVKVNFGNKNGLYYGYIYVNDGRREPRVEVTPGLPSLTDVYTNIKNNTTPEWANAILTRQ